MGLHAARAVSLHHGWYGPEGQLWPRSPSALAVACALLVLWVVLLALRFRHHGQYEGLVRSWLVLLVTMRDSRYIFLSSGPRCSASWPVWTRMTVTRWWCVLTKVIYIHVLAQRLFHIVQTVLRTIEFLQLLVDKVVDALVIQDLQVSQAVIIPVVTQRLIPVVQAVQQTVEISQSQFAAKWLMSRLSGSCRLSGAGCEETVVLPQLQL